MSKEADSGAKPEELQVEDQSTSETSSSETASSETASSETAELQDLMQPDSSDEQSSRLNEEALAAAEDAVSKGETALRGLPEEGSDAEGDDAPEPEPSWILRGLLILNLALMGVMLALPNANEGKRLGQAESIQQGLSVTQKPATPDVDPFVSAEPEQAAIFGDSWNRASQLAGRGDYEAASALLIDYMNEEGAMAPDFVKEQVYRNLSFYSWRLGNVDDAAEYGSIANSLTNATKLPLQLLREAEVAEVNGDGRLMRQAYARLLLVQSQVSPTEFNRISEAYLKLADSFRLEANRGEETGK